MIFFSIAKIIFIEAAKRPFKSSAIILAIILFILITAWGVVKTADYGNQLITNKQTSSKTLSLMVLWMFITSVTQPAKFILFLFLFGDLIENLLKKSVKMILFRRWEMTHFHLKTSKKNKEAIFHEKSLKNGAFQVFMHRGIKGMASIVSISICTILPRIAAMAFFSKSVVFSEIDTYMKYSCVMQFFSIIITAVVIMLTEVYFRKRMILEKAKLDSNISECIQQHDVIAYSNMENVEYENNAKNIKNYRKSVVYMKLSSQVLTMATYLVTNCIFFSVVYKVNSNYSQYPDKMMKSFLGCSNFILDQLQFASTTMIKFRKSFVESLFAYEFVQNIEEFDASIKVETPQSDKENDSSSEMEDTKENTTYNQNNIQNQSLTFSKSKKKVPFFVFDDFSILLGGKPLFSPLNFKIYQNEKVLIKGKNGGGKTSILNALFKRSQYTGRMFLDQKNVKQYSKTDLVEKVSVCQQKVNIFEKTILENLKYGNSASIFDVHSVCTALGIDEKTSQLEDGLETKIKQNGENLSGGELKKLTIARTLLKKSEIYWFDEPTAGLDLESEKKIIHIISKLKATVFCILHSDKFDSLFDVIITLDN